MNGTGTHLYSLSVKNDGSLLVVTAGGIPSVVSGFRGHSDSLFSKRCRLIVRPCLFSRRQTAFLWELFTGTERLNVRPGSGGTVHAVLLMPDGTEFAAAGEEEGRVYFYETRTGRLLRQIGEWNRGGTHAKMEDLKAIAYGGEAYAEAVALRERVLRKPLGLTFSPEFLALEKEQTTLGAYHDGVLVGCLLVKRLEGEQVQVRQVAVDDAWRGKGVGRKLMVFAEQYAAELGALQIVLSARETAVPFYLKLGYEVFGEPVMAIGLLHREMRKSVTKLASVRQTG